MSVELLRSLATSPLPKTVSDITEIDRLRVLAAAGLVRAVLPDVDARVQKAQVLGLSPEGEEALRRSSPSTQLKFDALGHGAWPPPGASSQGPTHYLDS